MYQIDQWVKRATKALESSQVPSARLDALILLEDALQKDRGWILANPSSELRKELVQELNKQIERRSKHEPLAYIRGKCEFYGREFMVTPATLQPRSETETIISMLKSLELPDGTYIADVGTGSGAIAISAKLELPHLIVQATEIQANALEVAQKNAAKLKADVSFYLGNLIKPLKDKNINVIVANLPYVPDAHTINQAAMQEPSVAIFGGKDGLDLYRQLFAQNSERTQKSMYILTESLPFQHAELQAIAKSTGYEEVERQDFIQTFQKS